MTYIDFNRILIGTLVTLRNTDEALQWTMSIENVKIGFVVRNAS